MRLGKPVGEAAVVASWLRAELDSERFAHWIVKALRRSGISQQVIQEPDLTSAEQNQARFRLLKLARSKTFRKFPWRQVEWFELHIDNREELGKLYTPFGDPWLAFTDGQRALSKAADFIQTVPPSHDPLKHVLGIQSKLEQGIRLEPPILTTSDRRLVRPVHILEGNVRLVSYYLYPNMPYPLRTYVGISPKLASWAHSEDTFDDIKAAFMQGGHS